MRTAVYYSNSDIRLEDRPHPKAATGEVVIKVEASGICGTDVLEWYRIHRAPLILGHEIAGTVSEIGDEVKGIAVGDRVTAAHHVPCQTCHYCLSGHATVCDTLRTTNFDPGGFAEYLRLPALNVDRGLFRLPEEIGFDEATFVEPLACVIRGQKAARFEAGQTVLVIGAGMAGLLHIQLAAASGAGRIFAVDINEYKLQAAKRVGADTAFNATEDVPAKIRDLNEGRLADQVVLCAGAPTAVAQALDSVERGGTILFFAATKNEVKIEKPINDIFWRNEITLTSSYAGDRADHATALKLIAAGRVKVADLITHRLPFSEIEEGFHLVEEGRESIKVIVYPHR